MYTIQQRRYTPALAFCLCLAAPGAWAQEIVTLGDLQAKAPVTLSRAELLSLLPGAKMSRSNEKGNLHQWTNEAGGDVIVSTDNLGTSGRGSSARGKWTVSEDGRFCMVVQWRKGESEDTCRFVLKTSDGYYATSKLEPATRAAYKLGISR